MPPKPVLGLMGSSPSGGAAALSTTAQLTALLQLAAKHNILDLDTARAYSNENGSAEALLGSVDKSLTSKFRIDTKAPAFMPGSLTKEKIQENYKLSLEALKEEKVNLYYLHG
jgi:aryl-alcohol dehydrogenase-like predicted oxidoreductase